MRELSFIIYQIPTGKKTVHHTRSGITYHTKKQKYNENALMTEMLPFRPSEPITDPVRLHLRLYFPVPKSKPAWWRAAALAGYIHHDKKPDDDNCRKQCADALEKLQFIKNDSQIYFGETLKVYSNQPRWEVLIVVNPNITRGQWAILGREHPEIMEDFK